MSKSPRSRAYRATRDVIGPEVCGAIGNALEAVNEHGSGYLWTQVEGPLRHYGQTAHHLRAALVAMLVLYVERPSTCPNCDARLTLWDADGRQEYACDPGCHLRRLLECMEAE